MPLPIAASRPLDDGRRAWLAFALGVAAIVLASRAVVASSGFRARPSLIGLGVASDLTLTLAAVAWLTLVRTGRLSPASLVAVVSAGVGIAAALLPPGAVPGVRSAARVAVPGLEVILLSWVRGPRSTSAARCANAGTTSLSRTFCAPERRGASVAIAASTP